MSRGELETRHTLEDHLAALGERVSSARAASRASMEGVHELVSAAIEAGLTISDISRLSGVSRMAIYNWLDPKMPDPMMSRAQSKLQYEVNEGRIKRPDACEQCGKAGRVHAHHDDYGRPLDVRWLCASCHARLHGNGKQRKDRDGT